MREICTLHHLPQWVCFYYTLIPFWNAFQNTALLSMDYFFSYHEQWHYLGIFKMCCLRDTCRFGDMVCLVSVELNWPQTIVVQRQVEGFLFEVLRDSIPQKQPYPVPQLPLFHKSDNSKRQCQEPPLSYHSKASRFPFQPATIATTTATQSTLSERGISFFNFYSKQHSINYFKRLEPSSIVS